MESRKAVSDGKFWSNKLMDLANLSATILVFGQIVGPQIYWQTLIIGIVVYAGMGLVAKALRR